MIKFNKKNVVKKKKKKIEREREKTDNNKDSKTGCPNILFTTCYINLRNVAYFVSLFLFSLIWR